MCLASVCLEEIGIRGPSQARLCGIFRAAVRGRANRR